MNIKALATIAATLVATSAWAGSHGEKKCGASSCGKKESSVMQDTSAKDASCGKKDSSCSKKDSSCSKKG